MTTECPICFSRLVDGHCLRCASAHSETLAPDDVARARMGETLDAITYDASMASSGAVGTPREPWPAGKILFDEFEVLRELGRGGMGVVYLVESKRSGQLHAVKRTRVVDPSAREALLAEVQTWKDLPEHPNLTACHFFRTLGDDVVIFAEHVDGGGLDDALAARPDWDERTRFDLAIQFALGLEAAHIAGYVHLDVKPGNALLSSDGTLKVTDFGLARSQQLLASGSGPAGLTPAFCSPEQAFRDQPITASSDVWSWAVSVMTLFMGRMRWETGIFAPGVLQLYRSGKLDDVACQIPDSLCDILAMCFHIAVNERWASSTALCNALMHTWENLYGEPYERVRARKKETTQRRDSIGSRTDPRRWLDEEAVELDRMGDIGQLALYDRAARRVTAGLETGEFEPAELGELLLEKGRLHHRTHDWPGALAAYRDATRFLNDDAGLAEASAGQARVFTELRRFDEAEHAYLHALDLFDKAGVRDDRVSEVWLDLAESRWTSQEHDAARESLASFEEVVSERDDEASREFRARHRVLLANLDLTAGRYPDAVTNYLEASSLYEDLILLDDRTDLRWRLFTSYFNLATGLTFERKLTEARRFFERAEHGLTRMLEEPGGKRWTAKYAQCLTNYSLCLRRQGELDLAREKLELAVHSFERVVHLEGRRDNEGYLTSAYMNLAMVYGAQGDHERAASLCERVVGIRRRLVEDEGRDDVRDRLAAVLGNWAYYLALADRNTAAISAYDESIRIRHALLEDGDSSVTKGLARQLLNRSELHEALGLWDAMREDALAATELLKDRDNDQGMMVEAAQTVALAEHRSRDDETARETLAWANSLLIRLAERTGNPEHVAEHQVRSVALSVMCDGLDPTSAIETISSIEGASDWDQSRAFLWLVRWAVETESESLSLAVHHARRLEDELTDIERLEVAAANGGEPELTAQLREAAERTGRYWLSELATRLST